MEREKLNEAAKQDAIYTVIGDLYERGNYEMGFVSGAEWLMQQPLSERLTEEEVEKLNGLIFLMRRLAASHRMSYDCLKHISNAIYDIFGKDIFIERQSKYAVVNTAFFGKEMFENKE